MQRLRVVFVVGFVGLGCAHHQASATAAAPQLHADAFLVTVVNRCEHPLAIRVSADEPDPDATGRPLAPEAISIHPVAHHERVWRQGATGWATAAWFDDAQPGGQGRVELRCGG